MNLYFIKFLNEFVIRFSHLKKSDNLIYLKQKNFSKTLFF